jgi:hypothetical protein
MNTRDEKLSIPNDRNGLTKLINLVGTEEDSFFVKSERLIEILSKELNVSQLDVRRWIERGYVPLRDIHPVIKLFPKLKPVDLVDPKISNDLEP